MNNYKLVIEYKGTAYNGWQRQKDNDNTIQGILEDAIFRLLKEKVKLIGSGRTDSGVHALNQVANFTTDSNINSESFFYSLNSIIPSDIAVKSLQKVKINFNARHDAKKRNYVYKITTVKNALQSDYFYRIFYSPDINLINSVIPVMIGYKSFRSLCKNPSDKFDFKCDVSEIKFSKPNSGNYIFSITSSRFLHSMVRAIGGALLDIGRNKLNPDEFKKKFTSGEKIRSPYLPANGLFLNKIYY